MEVVGEGLVNDIPFYLKVGLMVVFLVVSVSRLLRDGFWLVNYYLEKSNILNMWVVLLGLSMGDELVSALSSPCRKLGYRIH